MYSNKTNYWTKRYLVLPLVMLFLAGKTFGATSYDFTSLTSSGNVSLGNSTQMTVGGLTVTMTGWSAAVSGGTFAFSSARLENWNGYGLGVCSASEPFVSGVDCGIPEHSVDNAGIYEFVLFHFATPMTFQSVTLHPYNAFSTNYPNDRDVTYFVGSFTNSLNGVLLSSLGQTRRDSDSDQSNNARTVTINLWGQDLLFGTRLSGNSADVNLDYFKLENLTVSSTPEPGTLVMAGTALIALGWLGRRKHRKS